MISLIYYKVRCLLSTQILIDLRLDSSNFFLKTLVIVVYFLSFKIITHAYLLKLSIKHHKKRIPLLNLLINCISARAAPQCVFFFP